MTDYKITRRDPSKVYPKLPEILVGDNEETLVIYGDIDMTDYSELVKRLRSEIPYWRSHEQDTHLMTESADALEAQAKEIAELKEQLAEANAANLTFGNQSSRIAELEAALKPFADKVNVFHDYVDDYPIMFGAEPPLRVVHLRAARAALNGEK